MQATLVPRIIRRIMLHSRWHLVAKVSRVLRVLAACYIHRWIMLVILTKSWLWIGLTSIVWIIGIILHWIGRMGKTTSLVVVRVCAPILFIRKWIAVGITAWRPSIRTHLKSKKLFSLSKPKIRLKLYLLLREPSIQAGGCSDRRTQISCRNKWNLRRRRKNWRNLMQRRS